MRYTYRLQGTNEAAYLKDKIKVVCVMFIYERSSSKYTRRGELPPSRTPYEAVTDTWINRFLFFKELFKLNFYPLFYGYSTTYFNFYRCPNTMFFSSAKLQNENNRIRKLSRTDSWSAYHEMFKALHQEDILQKADWLFLVESDTFAIIENLR